MAYREGVEGLLLYDADCGFCTRVAGWLPALRLPVEVGPLQAADLESLGVSSERSVRELPFVGADGRVSYGHAAFSAALSTGRFPYRMLGKVLVLGPLDGVFRRIYAWVARNRHQLPGGAPSCELSD